MRALSGFIGFKGSVGGLLSQRSNATAQPWPAVETVSLESAQGTWNSRSEFFVKCLDITKNSDREGIVPGQH